MDELFGDYNMKDNEEFLRTYFEETFAIGKVKTIEFIPFYDVEDTYSVMIEFEYFLTPTTTEGTEMMTSLTGKYGTYYIIREASIDAQIEQDKTWCVTLNLSKEQLLLENEQDIKQKRC
jgi:hypothetical protein